MSERHDLARIERQRKRWIAAINAGDADGFVAPLAQDAVWLPPGHAISGRDGIREWVATPFSTFAYAYSVSDTRIRLAGDWAVEHSRFRTEAEADPGEPAPAHEGSYTILWRRSASGEWLIDRYVDHIGAPT